MAQTRSEKLQRLVKVQRHLEHMAENELAATARARAEIDESMSAAVNAIGSLDTVHQLFASIYSGQISRLTAKDQHLATMQQIQEQKILRERAKADRLAEQAKDAREVEDRDADEKTIYELLDQQFALSVRRGPL
ncbi:hypothetical protein [Rhizobium sp. LjRoot254]|uniref:hypothetical protein n=1 Tax=Rhizobium sp. LjRoot254 TaxID=3342297 RepID=UPI003ECDD045